MFITHQKELIIQLGSHLGVEGVAQPRRLSEYKKQKKRLNIFGTKN